MGSEVAHELASVLCPAAGKTRIRLLGQAVSAERTAAAEPMGALRREALLLVAIAAVSVVVLWNGLILASRCELRPWWWCMPGMVMLQLAVLAIRQGVAHSTGETAE